jgi:peptidoglycan hydrolase-like protein with peptidoglycan-binding domain
MSSIERMLWLPEVLRAAGVQVNEYPGWKTRSRPLSTGSFKAAGLMFHHDASGPGPSPSVAHWIAEVATPSAPPPASQIWVDYHGVWHVIAAGRANHAGTGGGSGAAPAARWVPVNSGNSCLIGVETDHTTGEQWPQGQYDAIVLGFAAILRHLGLPASRAVAHKEYAPGRKVDPAGVDMDTFRAQVARAMRSDPAPLPPADLPKPDPTPAPKPKPTTSGTLRRGDTGNGVLMLQKWLARLVGLDYSSGRGIFGPRTERAVKQFQRASGLLQDGVVGPKTWLALQSALNAPAKPTPAPAPAPARKPTVNLSNVQPGKRNEDVRALQRALRSLGSDYTALNPNGATGYYGGETAAMVARWQRECGFSGKAADGAIGITTLSRLAIRTGDIIAAR